ncbi:hypothetical protein SG26_20480 (plasmid) [Haloarcula sp. CBA1115]|uniref:hypothetical protein n=1 Tax=Haloarcula sp. CBA1115 TaxID=1592728 RepID=UPI0005955150|nr:hypothetical protein [Haloarcula sp. CBA1115]AJF28127.1 hypothetical protein SG26_20480 [Haloarcula sp. CBA1115]
MTDPLTAGVLALIFAMGCVTILLFNRQINQNRQEIARIKAREQSVEAAFEDLKEPASPADQPQSKVDRLRE